MKINKDKCLWTSEEIYRTLRQQINTNWNCNTIEFDSRKVQPGSIFFAMPGTKFDGHDFIDDAVKSGAVALIVQKSYKSSIYNNKLIKVDDVYKTLILMAQAARKRVNDSANIIAITGSSGKTSTKEMVSSALNTLGLTYSNPDSFNNHVGVPYTLVNMSRNIEFGVFEIGMNNFNEISKLAKLVKPNIAIITNVSEAHIGNFKSIKEVIKAKAEIFEGLTDKGYILINRDFEHYNEIITYSEKLKNINMITYGLNNSSDIYLIERVVSKKGQKITVSAYGKNYTYEINFDGLHQAINSLAVVGVLLILKCDVKKGLNNLYKSTVPIGRGNKYDLLINEKKSLLIDDSYNANPSSVIASLNMLSEIAVNNRKVLILGEMGELGKHSLLLHKKLYDYLINLNINLVIFVGKNTKNLYNISKNNIECSWSESAEQIIKSDIDKLIKPMDTILVKGSRYMKMEVVVNYLRDKYKIKVNN